MYFVGVQHKETFFNFAFTGEQIKALKFAMDHATFDFNSEEEPEGKEYIAYVTGQFYSVIKEVQEGL